jgi:hypothetical protein
MNKIKQRKRLALLSLVFLLVALTGAAFAFTPGMLDIVGQVGITEGEYVRWTMAEEQYGSLPGRTIGTPAASGVSHENINNGIFMSGLSPSVIVNEADFENDARGRTNQQVHWDVVFQSAGSARVYLEATNFSELHAATLLAPRIVQATAMPAGSFLPGGRDEFAHPDLVAPITLNPTLLESLFTISFGTALPGMPAGAMPMPGPPMFLAANNATASNPTSTSPVFFIELTWNGSPPGMAADFEWEHEYAWVPGIVDPAAGFWQRTGNIIRSFDGEVVGDYFWSESNPQWLGNFTIELDYHRSDQGLPTPPPFLP